MRERDEAYYARRAIEERQKSEQASDPASYRVHLEMARQYERRASPLRLRLAQP